MTGERTAQYALLPVGTVVDVTPFDGPPYRGVVRGYDIGRTKYNVGAEYLPGRYCQGGWWVFRHQVKRAQNEGSGPS